jgi:hypothetical protein
MAKRVLTAKACWKRFLLVKRLLSPVWIVTRPNFQSLAVENFTRRTGRYENIRKGKVPHSRCGGLFLLQHGSPERREQTTAFRRRF